MKSVMVGLVVLLANFAAWAEGLPLENGRYVDRVIVLTLTEKQKMDIAHFRACHIKHFKTMNVYTPYVFTLTRAQANQLAKKKGFSPKAFWVLETFRGDNDAGPFWNVALRFSESNIEIPLDLVLSDKAALKEVAMQGWQSPNPCFPPLGRIAD
jgi:hypothetical protein